MYIYFISAADLGLCIYLSPHPRADWQILFLGITSQEGSAENASASRRP